MIQLNKAQKIETLLQGIDVLKEKLSQPNNVNIKKNLNQTAALKTNHTPITSIPMMQNKQKSVEVVKDEQDKDSEQNADAEKTEETEFDQSSGSENKVNISFGTLKEGWQQLIDEMKKHKIAYGNFLDEGKPEKLEGNTLTIAFGMDNGFHISYLERNHKEVEAIINKILGSQLKIKFKKTKPENSEGDSKNSNYIDKVEEKIPVIKTIVEVFDGEIVG